MCSEYYEAERVVLSADGRGVDAFVVSGQHGIDSSPSLAVASGIRYLIREIRLLALASHGVEGRPDQQTWRNRPSGPAPPQEAWAQDGA